jgi:fluoroacetyl-CoA thioesterase
VKNPFKSGDTRSYHKVVGEGETAEFPSGTVHPVYSTFSLARDAEWSTRLFVLEMKEEDEEGIGTFVEVQHHAPALVGTVVSFTASLEAVNGHEIICSFTAHADERLIASGRTGQKILKKEKVERLIEGLRKEK